MADVTVVVHFGYVRPRRAMLRRWRHFGLSAAIALNGARRPWVRYALIAEVAGNSWPVTYKVVGYRWTRRGARCAVDALRRGQR